MIGTIRKHQNWLWAVIIAATIVSFVYLLSPSNRNGNVQEGGSVNFGSVYGEPITREQMASGEREGRIFYRLNYGEWPDSADKRKNLESYAQQRCLLDAAMQQYHIEPTQEAAARVIRRMLGIKPTDNVPADKVFETLDNLGKEGGVTRDDFARYAMHTAGQEYLMALMGMSGRLITPQEVEVFYKRENSPLETELVAFPAEKYASSVTVAETNIESYYVTNEPLYRIPERIQVNYIAFTVSNYTTNVEKELGTNLKERIDQQYLQAGAGAFKDEAGTQLSADAAKVKIRKAMLLYGANAQAVREAQTFLNELAQGHDDSHPYSTNDIFELAKKKGLTVKTSTPFSEVDGSKELNLVPKFLHALFSMKSNDPDDKENSAIYAPLVRSEDVIYVVGLQKTLPSEVQPLPAVREKVIADYREHQAQAAAHDAGKKFEGALEAGMAQGKTFDTMCAAQFVRPQKLGAFTLSSTNVPGLTNKQLAEAVMQVAARLRPGLPSPFIPTTEGGFVLYVKSELPADSGAMQHDLPLYLDRMRNQLQMAAFNAWFSKEYQQHFVPPPGSGPTGG